MNASFLPTSDAAMAWLAQQPLTDAAALAACGEQGAWRRRLVEAVFLLSEERLVAVATESQGQGFPRLDHPETGVALDARSLKQGGLAVGLAGPAWVGDNHLFTTLGVIHVPGLEGLKAVPASVVQEALSPLVDLAFQKRLSESLHDALERHPVGEHWHSELRAWALNEALPEIPRSRSKTPRF